ncbi:MAG TPA: alkaline phosphatase family protein, partial [Vicinamibacteria bacterium]|nr:alkaline phosphatase family protein [Vicinamibacteria bacterium]
HLLLLRLPAPDRYQHQYGPQHYLSKAALTASDYNIGLVRRAIEDSGLANQTTLVVVSDHGFHTAEYSVNVYPVFEKAGLANKVRLHGGYWSVVVELTDRFEESKDGKALEDALSRAARLDGVAVVVRPEDFHALGIPRYDEDPHILGQYLIIGSIDTRLVVDEQDSSSRRERLPTPYYGHGFLPSDERMYAVFLATGRRVRMGVRVGRVQNYDLAPTVCDLLGLDMPGLPGRILTEILE